MPDLQIIRSWLMSWPQWDSGAQLYVDYTDTVPGNCGLFPSGLEEVNRKTDLVGNTRVRCRYRFTLYRVTEHQEGGMEDAQWLALLQQWVQQQSIAGLTPKFGDEPAAESIRAEKGRLTRTRQPGNAMYAVEFTAEFIKNYEVI